MNRLIACVCLAVLTGLTFASDSYWVGGTSGNWSDAANWDPAVVPASDSICVHITNTVPVKITCGSEKIIGAIEFSGANHEVVSYLTFRKSTTIPKPYIYVAEGCTATLANYTQASLNYSCSMTKTGKGTAYASGTFGYRAFDTCEVKEGTLKFKQAKMRAYCLVRSGAKLVLDSYSGFIDVDSDGSGHKTIVELEEGAIFDGGDYACTFGGVIGSGIVTNFHVGSNHPVMTAGPLAFSGRLYGMFDYRPVAAAVTGEDGGYLLIGDTNTLKNAKLVIGGDAAYTNNVRFAPGIGTFKAKHIVFDKASPIVLEDTNGVPVRLEVALINSDGSSYSPGGISYYTGKGTLVKSVTGVYTSKGADITGTGKLILDQSSVTVGSGTASEDSTGLANLEAIELASGMYLYLNNANDTAWSDVCVTGAGTVSLKGAGNWTLGNFSLAGGRLLVDEAATATSLTLSGGTSSQSYSIGPSTFETVFSGGDHTFSTILSGKDSRTYRQTGGTVTAQINGTGSADPIFYTMTGGRLSCRMTQYNTVGLDLSGTAEAEILETGSIYPLLTGHTIRLRDEAVLRVNRFSFGFPSSSGTGIIQLDGGTLECSGWLGYVSGATSSSPIRTELLFNGGVLRSTASEDVTWSAYDDPGLTTGKVQAGGAKIDVVGSSTDRTLTLTWPFVSDASGGTDGGFLKTGSASLKLQKGCNVTGPFTVSGGRVVSVDATANEAVAGCGSVVLNGTDLALWGGVAQPLCANAGATFSFDGAASLSLAKNGAITVGASSAAAESVLVRSGHGVLFVSSGVTDERLGSSVTVTVSGGAAVESGRCALPIFERCPVSGSGIQTVQRIRFLTCDGSNRLVPATTVAFDPSTSSRATVAEISGDRQVNLTDDAFVGALNVERVSTGSRGYQGLVIADGKTLFLGPNKAGLVAPLILNNTYAGDTGSASVLGGKIDFGASECVIALNYRQGDAAMVPEITSVLAGKGALAIAAPTALRNSYAGTLALRAANTYTGGTWIEGAVVYAGRSGCFSAGTVRVGGSSGDAGSVVFSASYDSDTFANALEVAGTGPRYITDATLRGVLVFNRGLDLTGGVTLFGDSTFVADAATASSPVVFSAPVTGTGDLTVAGAGKVRLTAANTYAGATVVKGGVLEIVDEGTLGTGPVTVAAGATLRFVGAAARTVTNPISGAGRVECAGGSVTFSDLSGFAGEFGFDLTGDNATIDLGGADITVASLSGSARIVNGRLTITGEIQPGGAHAAGTLTFARAPIVTGATLVVDGSYGTRLVDRLVVEEAFDLTGLALRVPQLSCIRQGEHEIVTASAGLTGEFASFEKPAARDMTVSYSPTAAMLRFRSRGLVFFVH